MSNYIVQNRATGQIVYAYSADEAVDWPDYPFATHNHALHLAEDVSPPRRITRIQLVARIGDAAFKELLTMSKSSVEVEAMIKLIEWATPEQDGTSIDLDDPHFVALQSLEPMLVAKGLVTDGWAAKVVA